MSALLKTQDCFCLLIYLANDNDVIFHFIINLTGDVNRGALIAHKVNNDETCKNQVWKNPVGLHSLIQTYTYSIYW